MSLDDSSYREALEFALKKLRTRDRYESEVRLLLGAFEPLAVERVIRLLKERRIIDDTKTTQNLIERYSGKRSVGAERLRAELLERGAPEETVDAILGLSFADQRQTMFEALSSKFSREGVSRVKAARFLVSRGFPEEEIEGVLDRFFQA
jgi:SOS response regulatory protein OraA/RecX